MHQFRLFLKIMFLFGIVLLLVGCAQATETQQEEVAEITEPPPTETQLPPTPTATQVPPTETEVLPTETPTTEPTKVLTEVEFIKDDLLGTWVSDKQPNMSMSFEENGKAKLFEKGVLSGEIADYDLKGDVLSHTLSDCVRMVGGATEFFTCSADYQLTYYTDEDNQAYLSFELIGEDLHNYRKGLLSSGALWAKVD